MGCAGYITDGIRVPLLPIDIRESCPHPSDIIASVRGITVGDDEVRLGRVGDALIECGAEKDIAVAAYAGIAETLK